jgi:hypothetical protein
VNFIDFVFEKLDSLTKSITRFLSFQVFGFPLWIKQQNWYWNEKKMRRKWKLVTTYLVTTSVNGFHVQRCCNSFFNVYFISSSSFFIIFFSKCYSFFLSFIFWVFYIFFFVSFTAILISFEGQVVSVSSQSQFASIKNKFSFTNSRFIYFVSPSNVTLIVANLYVRGGYK